MAFPERSYESRLAVAERTLADHDQEIELARQRYHASESDRQALHLMVQVVKELPQRMNEIAAKAASDAVAIALDTGRKESGHRLQWAAIVFTALGFLASIYFNTR